MIKENILGKCLRCRSSRGGPRISPLAPRYECPRPSLLTITSGPQEGAEAAPPRKTSKIGPRSYSIMPCCSVQARAACFEHSVLFKVKSVGGLGHPMKGTPDCLRMDRDEGSRPPAPHAPPDSFGRSLSREDAALTPRPELRRGKRRDIRRSFRHQAPRPAVTSDYELFNRNNFNIRYWSWSYRGCWHQTCPPMVPR